MPNVPYTVAALIYDGLTLFEYSVAAEIFGLKRPEFDPPLYRFLTVAECDAPVITSGGLSVQTHHGLQAASEADLIIIPGWNRDTPVSAPVRDMVLSAHARGARIASLCSGAFLLAELGLLDGRRCTTHWAYAAALAARYPRVTVLPDVLYTDEGDILTSAGSAAAVDLLLHIVRSDYDASVANKIARRLVMPPHRTGGQKQFIPAPVPTRPDARLAELTDLWVAEPARAWTVPMMADFCAMSPRSFSRHFTRTTGQSPAKYLNDVRLAHAIRLLEEGAWSIDRIAAQTGLGQAEHFTRHFKRMVGLSPGEYRRRFGTHITSA